MNWYYLEDGNQVGPVEETEFNELVRSGKINAGTQVWNEGMSEWLPYGEIGGGGGAPPALDGEACVECGETFSRSAMIQHGNKWVCANCKPLFLQKISEGAYVETGELNYAGFGIRFAAKIVDGIILGICIYLPVILFFGMAGAAGAGAPSSDAEAILGLLIQFGQILVSGAYTIFFLGKFGATPGKMACKIMVVDEAGARIGFGRATGRFFAEMLSGLICYIGYIMAGFDPEKRTLHDRMCSTRVVYKERR